MVYCPVDERRMDEWALGGYSDFRHNQKTYDFFKNIKIKKAARIFQLNNLQTAYKVRTCKAFVARGARG